MAAELVQKEVASNKVRASETLDMLAHVSKQKQLQSAGQCENFKWLSHCCMQVVVFSKSYCPYCTMAKDVRTFLLLSFFENLLRSPR